MVFVSNSVLAASCHPSITITGLANVLVCLFSGVKDEPAGSNSGHRPAVSGSPPSHSSPQNRPGASRPGAPPSSGLVAAAPAISGTLNESSILLTSFFACTSVGVTFHLCLHCLQVLVQRLCPVQEKQQMSLRLKVGGRNLRQQRLHPPPNLPQLKVTSLVCYSHSVGGSLQ